MHIRGMICSMRPLTRSLCCSLFFVAGLAIAQTPAAVSPNAGFDCWVGHDGKPFYTAYIRCIADRDVAPDVPLNTPIDSLVELLHRELHEGSSRGAEKAFNANVELIREAGGVWSICIHAYPSDWSWDEGMPERLVRGVLCPQEGPCPVMIRR